MSDFGRKALDFSPEAKIVYDSMSKKNDAGVGREMLVARGLIEWLTYFHKLAPMGKGRNPLVLSSIVHTEPMEDIVVIFANMLLKEGPNDDGI